jgi:hypothetical protein
LSNEEKTNDYENFEKGMIYMKIWKKEGSREKGEEETKSMPHAPVVYYMHFQNFLYINFFYLHSSFHAYNSTSNDTKGFSWKDLPI